MPTWKCDNDTNDYNLLQQHVEFQELRAELANSKKEVESYLQKYNSLLDQVDKYKQEKERAELKLERYSEFCLS